MNPLAIRATNLRTFEQLDLELPSGCVVIGGANGAGKSTILNAIDVALFADRGELPALLSLGEEELQLELQFEHAGELYRVRRLFSARGRGKTTLDLEYFKDTPLHSGDDTGPQWEPLTRETAVATQQHLEQLLGLSRATFRASSFLAQGDGAAFTEAQPRDRKAILAEILGLDIWDRLLDQARGELRGCELDLATTSAAIAGCDEQAARKPDVVTQLALLRTAQNDTRAALTAAETHLEEAQRQHSSAAALAQTVRTCAAELAAATIAHSRAVDEFSAATKAAHELADKVVELGEVSADAARVPELEQRVEELRAAAAEIAKLVAQRDQLFHDAEQRALAHERLNSQAAATRDEANTLRGRGDHLEAHIDEAADCDRCGQKLGADAAARAAASYRAEADTLAAKAAEIEAVSAAELETISALRQQVDAINRTTVPHVPDPEPVERELRAARAAGEQRARLAEQVEQLTARVARTDELEQLTAATAKAVAEKHADLDAARANVPDITVLTANVERHRVAVDEGRRLVEQRQAEIVRAEGDLERIVDAEQKLAEHRAAVETISTRVDVLKLAERAYGRDGIPALIVENAAIPQLELEANRILGELGGATAGCRVELRTQRALKTSEALRETLDIVIVTPTGERAYETFSGGERTRLNLSLRIALARLLAHRRGAESRLLAIDEPDGLDQAGMQALATVLRGVGGDFERILLVSHHPDLATEFEQSIVVVKDGERSRVDAGVSRQSSDAAVAA